MVALAERLGVGNPVGVESAEALVQTATERTGCKVIRSSVFHHLVGNTRRTSKKNVRLALKNAGSVVAPGGLLVIHEPVFRPAISLGMLFYTKLPISKLVKGRVPIGSYWANVGAPVVSFLTPGELERMVSPYHYLDLVKTALPKMAHAGGIFGRYDASVITQFDA
jgi:hypothetical protein